VGEVTVNIRMVGGQIGLQASTDDAPLLLYVLESVRDGVKARMAQAPPAIQTPTPAQQGVLLNGHG
jgi:hypothetical protein